MGKSSPRTRSQTDALVRPLALLATHWYCPLSSGTTARSSRDRLASCETLPPDVGSARQPRTHVRLKGASSRTRQDRRAVSPGDTVTLGAAASCGGGSTGTKRLRGDKPHPAERGHPIKAPATAGHVVSPAHLLPSWGELMPRPPPSLPASTCLHTTIYHQRHHISHPRSWKLHPGGFSQRKGPLETRGDEHEAIFCPLAEPELSQQSNSEPKLHFQQEQGGSTLKGQGHGLVRVGNSPGLRKEAGRGTHL